MAYNRFKHSRRHGGPPAPSRHPGLDGRDRQYSGHTNPQYTLFGLAWKNTELDSLHSVEVTSRNGKPGPGAAESDTANTTPLQLPSNNAASSKSRTPVPGTDRTTGINPGDDKHGLQTHSRLHLSKIPETRRTDLLKNYRVTYDPELDKSLLKADRKLTRLKLRFQTEIGPDKPAIDPRLKMGTHNYVGKPNKLSKKMPFKHLPQTRLAYDKDSVGDPPQTEVVVWDLPLSVNESYFTNFFESLGKHPIRLTRFVNDPLNAVPLGIATFTFQGSPEKAARFSNSLLKAAKQESVKIDGVVVSIGMNDHEGKFLELKIKAAQDRLNAIRQKREQEKREQEKREQEKREQEKREQEARMAKSAKETKKQEEPVAPREQTPQPVNPKLNTTTLSTRNKNKVIKGTVLPQELEKYVKDRPWIWIPNKFVPTTRVSSQDVKKVLMKYAWTRVLTDKTGFYVVFNTIKEAEHCFYAEDGLRFFEYRMFMELCVPEKFVGDDNVQKTKSASKSHDTIDEAVNLLIKEFQTFLSKDIRERVIAPTILELLLPDLYPELMQELKEKEAAQKELERQRGLQRDQSQKSKEKDRSLGPVFTLPSFTKKLGIARKKKNLFPMQHALNYDDQDSDDSDGDDSSRSATPGPLKRDHSSVTSPEDDADHRKKSRLRETFLYESSEDEMDEDVDEKLEPLLEDEQEEITQYDLTRTAHPLTVYEEKQSIRVLALLNLQSLLLDDEDMAYAQKVLEAVEPTPVPHPEYWAWKQAQAYSGTLVSEEDDLAETLSNHLECSTGSFKSEGYRKIADADKAEYLPHRRKVHEPLKTVQHDTKETSVTNNNSNSNVQSSRVNRANNRRFAADISAQKQILGSELDILNLNALTKRKKPVSFARSAIHNWGLYANEFIAAKEMIIEYVGESIRQQVAEHREKSYMRTGIGSSYLFRIDENTVIDATKKGGIARFINHCCSPSCTAKIIKVDGDKRIVIYALRDIEANEELTYDYKFERETNDDERIICLCGAPGCKGYLN